MSDQTRVHAGVPTGGQYTTLARTESTVALAEPTEDDLAFARETLGPNATDDEVRNLADQRLDRDWEEMTDTEQDGYLPGQVDQSDESFFPSAPMTPRDVETLVENKGRFAFGHDADDVNRLFGRFDSARLVCIWDRFDDDGYGGGTQVVGIARHQEIRGTIGQVEHGSWRSVHPDALEFLTDPHTDLDPWSIPSLLADEVLDGPDVDDLGGDGFSNLAVEVVR